VYKKKRIHDRYKDSLGFISFVAMKIKKAEFVGSFVTEDACPKDMIPEYAFVGRSNVGKSSLINYIVKDNDLAKVSGTPGKTQTINFFNINDNWNLVDLPGYGYARVGKKKREEWDRFIRYYLKNRKQLMCTFVLIDSRIPPQKIDLEFVDWLGAYGLPLGLIFTKLDKANSPKSKENIELFQAKMLENWEVLPPSFATSAFRREGKEALLDYLDSCNKQLLNTK